MSRSTSQHQSNQSLNFELHTDKKQRPINQSQDNQHTGYGMIPNTQRKPPIYDLETALHFDKKTTPLKYDLTTSKQQNSINQSSSDTIKYRQTLQKLDQTQEKLVLSDKKYGELWRKYEAACDSIKSLNKQLSKAQQKPFDLQVKCNLLQKERDELSDKVRQKQTERDRARDSLSHTNGKVHRLEDKLEQAEQVIKKMTEEAKLKFQTIQKLEHELNSNKEDQNRSYERIVATLKQQIQMLHSQLTLKTQELTSLQHSFYSKTLIQKQQPSSTASHLHTQLNKLHKEKLELVADYEQKLSLMEKSHKFQLQQTHCKINELTQKLMTTQVDTQLKAQQNQHEYLNQIKQLQKTNETLAKDNHQLTSQLDHLQLSNNYLENQLARYSQENQKTIQQLEQSATDRQQLKQLFYELQSIKKQFSSVRNELRQKQHQLQQASSQKEELIQQISKLQLSVKAYENLQIQYDKQVKAANDLMLDKMSQVEAQRELMQRELLAERLQTIKLKEQLSQQQLNLKRQYQLSLSNVKSELSQKIVSIREEKNSQTIEKEKIYSQMKELERKYELLASQMLTVNDMMSIATKVHKRHSQFIKK